MSCVSTCRPTPTKLWQWPLVVFCSIAAGGAVVFFPLLLSCELLNHFQTSTQVKVILLCISVVLGPGVMFAFVRWMQNPYYWMLTEEALIGGRNHTVVIPLSSIQRVVPGIPMKTNIVIAANKYLNPDIWSVLMMLRQQTLYLKLADGRTMAFNVRMCENGAVLMQELIARVKDRFDTHYCYSKQEENALRWGRWNCIKAAR